MDADEPKTLENGERFTQLTDAAVIDDGEFVAFTIKTLTGKDLRVHCQLVELGDVFQFLATLARHAGTARNAPEPATSQTYNELAPVPIDGIGFQLGQTRETTIVVVRFPGFDLALEIQNSGLAQSADDFSRILRLLSARGRPQ